MTEFTPLSDGFSPSRYGALNALWADVLRKSLGLDAESGFQAVLGAAGQVQVQGPLWNVLCDTQLGEAPAIHCASPGLKRRSAGYRRLISALQSDTELALQTRLGAHYSDWVRFRCAPDQTDRQVPLFRRWCQTVFSGAEAANLAAGFESLARTDALIAARDRLAADMAETVDRDAPGRGDRYLPAYSTGAIAPDHDFFYRPGGRIDFDCAGVTDRPGLRAAQGTDRILPGARGGIFDPLERKVLGARLTISGNLGQCTIIPVDPCAWYDPQIVDFVHHHAYDQQVWDPNSAMGGWAHFFGPGGVLEKSVTRLVLVRDYDVTVTFHAQFTASEQQTLRAMTQSGVWPLLAEMPGRDQQIDLLDRGSAGVSLRLRQVPDGLACLGRMISTH